MLVVEKVLVALPIVLGSWPLCLLSCHVVFFGHSSMHAHNNRARPEVSVLGFIESITSFSGHLQGSTSSSSLQIEKESIVDGRS